MIVIVFAFFGRCDLGDKRWADRNCELRWQPFPPGETVECYGHWHAKLKPAFVNPVGAEHTQTKTEAIAQIKQLPPDGEANDLLIFNRRTGGVDNGLSESRRGSERRTRYPHAKACPAGRCVKADGSLGDLCRGS